MCVPVCVRVSRRAVRRYTGVPRNIYRHILISDLDRVVASIPPVSSNTHTMLHVTTLSCMYIQLGPFTMYEEFFGSRRSKKKIEGVLQNGTCTILSLPVFSFCLGARQGKFSLGGNTLLMRPNAPLPHKRNSPKRRPCPGILFGNYIVVQ